MEKERGTFRGSIGFVLAAAGSAVGLGNIWRFPYLAARDGGGLFLVVYLVLAVTFGFSLLLTEVSIGRKTKQSPLTAYGKLSKGWGWIGVLACVVPFMILPYYCVIGGWVMKYLVAFATGGALAAAEDGFFTGFITAQFEPIIYLVLFVLICAVAVFRGVNKGIEAISEILMPLVFIMVIGIAVFSLTIRHEGPNGKMITGLDGLKVYLIPNLEGIGLKQFFTVVMDALGQLFYSLSVAMGIMVAYGSYLHDKEDLGKAVNRIEIFDTLVAFFAGIMIIPAVYVFMGAEGMSAGPSLMFISLPKIFAAMGTAGTVVGTVFFAMVLFAAVTSGISLLEAVVSSFMDRFKLSRNSAAWIETVLAIVIGIVVCLGYNIWYFEYTLPNGSVAQILDIMDYISNLIFMPVITIATCILVGWVIKPETIISEAEKNGEVIGRRGLYEVMVKFVSPAFVLILLLIALGIF